MLPIVESDFPYRSRWGGCKFPLMGFWQWIPMVYFLFGFDVIFEGLRPFFETSVNSFPNNILALRLIEILAKVPGSAKNCNFFLLEVFSTRFWFFG